MKLFQILDLDRLMNDLLAGEAFDFFYVRKAELCTMFSITIDGKRNQDWFETEQTEYLQWREVRPYVFERIKGSKLPRFLRVELFLPVQDYQSRFQKTEPETEALECVRFKLSYEKKVAVVTTGISSSTFSLNREPEHGWDETVGSFLKQLRIAWEG